MAKRKTKKKLASPHAEQDKYPDSGEYFAAMRAKEAKRAERKAKRTKK